MTPYQFKVAQNSELRSINTCSFLFGLHYKTSNLGWAEHVLSKGFFLLMTESFPLRNLRALSLRNNNFSSSMGLQGKFAHIFHISSFIFKKIWLKSSLFTWTKVLHLITAEICKLKNLQELDLTGNKLVGHFPLCLTNLTRLRSSWSLIKPIDWFNTIFSQ